MKKAVIVSYYRWWEKRQKYFAKWLIENGYSVDYVIADFDHISKSYSDGQDNPDYCVKIHVPAYTKNISINRVYSNLVFCKKLSSYLEDKMPQVIVCLIPSNFLGECMFRYRSRYKDAKIIIDILDLWPESLPIKESTKRLLNFPFTIWKKMRIKAFQSATYVIFECGLFKKMMEYELRGKASSVLYLQKSEREYVPEKTIVDSINFAYIGSINNIIDIETITKIISRVGENRKVKLEIIGCGSNEQEFVHLAQSRNIETIFHGAIFDDKEKKAIFSRCHFGINIMKRNVAVGLTTKSMEYLESGLPLLNSIPADTSELIVKYGAGINIYDEQNIVDSLSKLTQAEYNRLQLGAIQLYDNEFSTKIFEKKLNNILKEIIGGNNND